MATYKGIAFPFQKGPTSFPLQATDSDLIKASILQILLTPKGSRVNRPDFGTDLLKYVLEPNTNILGELVRLEVSGAISKWEPRAIVSDTNVTRTEDTLTLTVTFIETATQRQQSLAVQYAI